MCCCRHVVRCEMPNAKLYKFDGAVANKLDPLQPHVPLTIDNLLLRGCTLRKTSWVVSALDLGAQLMDAHD